MSHRNIACITVCSNCEGAGGEAFAVELRVALAKADLKFEVRDFDCMSNCSRPLSVAFNAPKKATYLFGDVDTGRDLIDVIAFAAMYANSNDGWIDDARGAGRLRHCLIGRVPA